MNNTITCPKCGHHFDAEQAMSRELEAHYKEEMEQKVRDAEKKFRDEQSRLIEKERKKLQKAAEEEVNEKMKSLEEENARRKKENQELKKAELELMRKEAALKEKEEDLKLEIEKQLLRERSEIEAKAKAKAEANHELQMKQMQNKLDDAIKQVNEIKRKAELGSQQSQGEVQEEAIEEWLMAKFPLDTIEEIKKGERGADCMQIIHTRARQNCGRIYYESKRAQNFNANWIEKFKNDIREKGADIGVLVTQVLPADMERMGMKDGVWVCTFEEFKGLSFVLRDSIIRLSNTVQIQENKGDKMVMLYDYLTSNEFRLNVEGIVEGFMQMQSDLDREKRSMAGHWKRREKQLEKVVMNTNYFYNSIKGIAGNAIQSVEALELPEGD